MSSLYKSQCRKIVEDYRASGGAWPAKKTEIAEWALRNKLWQPSREDILHMCAEAMVDAMQGEEFTDPKTGIRARAKIPAQTRRGGEQGTFWADLRDAAPEFAKLSVAQWRKGMVNSSFTWDKIVTVFNAHHEGDEQISLSLDFSKDVKELYLPAAKTPRNDSYASAPSPRGGPRLRVVRDSDSRPARRRPSFRPSGPGQRRQGEAPPHPEATVSAPPQSPPA